jgi:hypothetical protein
MKRTKLLMVLAIGIMVIQCGCGSKEKVQAVGFLSDYSRLITVSDSSLQYVNKSALAKYSTVIIDPVEAHFHEGANAIEDQTKGKLTEEKIKDLRNYMHSKIAKAAYDAGYRTVWQPGPTVARIRVALTDISKSSVASLIPQAKLIAGAGIGGASMEAEIVDSITGEQILAVVESKTGTRIPFANLGKWDAAKQVIDGWAKRLKMRLIEAQGKR